MACRPALPLRLAVVVAFAAAAVACSKRSSSSGAPFRLSGRLGSTYAAAAPVGAFRVPGPSAAIAGPITVTEVLALPLGDGGPMGEQTMKGSKRATIAKDGTFSLELDNSQDWILVLLDASVTPTQFVGYVDLSGDTAAALLVVPVTSAVSDSVDVGTLSASGDLAVTDKPASSAQYAMTASQLLELARADDTLKLVKNLVLNWDAAKGLFYLLRPDFHFRGTLASIENAAGDPSTYVSGGYNFQLDSNWTAPTIAQVCGDGVPKVAVALYPPDGVTVTAANPYVTPSSYDATHPEWNDSVTCTTTSGVTTARDSDFYATTEYGPLSVSFYNGIAGDVAAGLWTVRVDGTTIGSFDVAVGSPIAGGKPTGYVPSPTVHVDGSGRITSVDVDWLVYDAGSGNYVAVPDATALRHIVAHAEFMIGNESLHTGQNVAFVPVTTRTFVPASAWYYPGYGPSNQQISSLGVFFDVGGVGHFYQFYETI